MMQIRADGVYRRFGPWRQEMPMYEYQCSKCDHEFEEFARSMDEKKNPRCPACQGDKVQRKLSVFAARQSASKPAVGMSGGGCGRCGDPQGPCSN